MSWPNGKTVIHKEGKFNKFPVAVEQISYNGTLPKNVDRKHYISLSALYSEEGKKVLKLIEIAPGIDLDRDILAHMDFRPEIAKDLKMMDERLFFDRPMGLAKDLASKSPVNIPKRLVE